MGWKSVSKMLLLFMLIATLAEDPRTHRHCSVTRLYCADLKTALECGQVDYCHQTAWKDSVPHLDDSDPRCVKCLDDLSNRPHLHQNVRKLVDMGRVPIACKIIGECQFKSSAGTTAMKASRSAKVGTDKCTYGEIHWCSSLGNAVDCEMDHYCTDIWIKKQLITSRHGDICQACQRVLSFVHMTSELPAHINRECKTPAGETSELCSTPVYKHFTQLVSSRNATVSPAVLCSLIGLCEGELVEKRAQDQQLTCDMCRSVCRSLDDRLKTEPAMDGHEVLKILFNDCGDFQGNHRVSCEQSVFNTVPEVFRLMGTPAAFRNHHVSPDLVCLNTHQCQLTSANKLTCDVCTTVVMYTRQLLENNKTAEEIEQYLDKHLCTHMHSFEQACIDFIHKDLHVLIEMIDSSIDAEEICKRLKLCQSNASVVPFSGSLDQQTVIPTGFDLCSSCKKTVKHIRARVICSVKMFFNFFLNQICAMVGPLENRCMTITDEIKRAIIHGADILLDANTTCSAFCRGRESLSTKPFSLDHLAGEMANILCVNGEQCMERVRKPMVEMLTYFDGASDLSCSGNDDDDDPHQCGKNDILVDMCFTCQSIEVEDLTNIMWMANNSQAGMEKLLPTICGHMQAEKECQEFFRHFGAATAALLERRSEPERLCQSLNVCAEDSDCLICSLFGRELEKQFPVDHKISRDELDGMLPAACEKLDQRVRQCKQFVHNYGPAILTLIVDRNTMPRKICRSLNVCYGPTTTIEALPTVSPCTACQVAVQVVEDVMLRNVTEDDVLDIAKAQCARLPSEMMRQKCIDLVDNDFKKIVQLLELLGQPHLVCLQLGLCGQRRPYPVSSGLVSAGNHSFCSGCEKIMILTQAWMQKVHVAEDLKPYLRTACKVFPDAVEQGTLYRDCLDAMDTIDRLLVGLLGSVDFTSFCRRLDLCPSAMDVLDGSVRF